MSYSKTVSRVIRIPYSGSVSYPASEHGGSVSYHGTATEEVVVNVTVDTEPFDNSASKCGGQVDLLTGSVAATETAQVASIQENSRKIGKTLIDGFFKTVRSEISQQINELKNTVEATLLKLQSDARRCAETRHQMEVDYNRKCTQYLKIFSDLDKELENRIRNLDQPTFQFRSDADALNGRLAENDMVPTVSISGGENALLGAQLSATLTKHRATEALGKASHFLQVQKHTADTITSSMINSENEGDIFLPVCYMEYANSNGYYFELYNTSQLNDCKAKIGENLRNQKLSKPSEGDMAAIRRYFNEELSSQLAAGNHDDRVREQIIRLFNK